ncbi:hypothetical protein HDF26_004568 [Pedobacter cryoconitis]|uniref:hypothetical protein n=1 Tax=Pedobacter cryoconitis TaxID=188932 RepID=UPI001613A73B|nr:hypothetical protein [Pedobacter cryoconitis]MBB6274095.1 hypothetical protein [Pedobacter cryoconitis]
MKNNCTSYILVLLSVIFFIGCVSFDLQKKIKSASLDHDVSKSEFLDIQAELKEQKDSKYDRFKNSEVLYEYIKESLRKQHITAEVWNPKPLAALKPFNVNVYLENSVSMDGYVEGVTDFENTIYDMLARFKMNRLGNSLNLSYINNKIPFTYKNAGSEDIDSFIKDLNPLTFAKKGGNRSSSDLAAVIKTVLNKTDDQNLSILISDFVFSPGSGTNANLYLSRQKTNITLSFREKLEKTNLSMIVYRMASDFTGMYFDLNNKPTRYNGKRPYYIWIIGTENQLRSVLSQQVIHQSNKNFLDKTGFKSTKNPENIPYKILLNGRTGDFSPGVNRDELINVKALNGQFGFSLALNFKDNIRGDDYFLDPENFKINDGYHIISRLLTEKEKESPSLRGFTHLLSVKTNKFNNQNIDIIIQSKLPSWVDRSTSSDDTNIKVNKDEQLKTFGLKYLIEGVSDAFKFYPDEQQNVISKIRIKIK